MTDTRPSSTSSSRTTVSECRTISISELAADSDLTPGTRGIVTWTRNEKLRASLEWLVVCSGTAETDTAIRLIYSVTWPRLESSTTVDLLVPLEYTPCTFGGQRPWFRCPADSCDERVGKLYLPPKAEEFRCRHCYDLTYESCQRSGTIRYEAFAKAAARERRIRKRFEEKPLDLELLRDLYEVQRDQREALDRFATQYTSDMELPPFPSFDEWYEEIMQNVPGEHQNRPYGHYGRCTATAKTTGQRCRQPAVGAHRKCYYHGGAAPEG